MSELSMFVVIAIVVIIIAIIAIIGNSISDRSSQEYERPEERAGREGEYIAINTVIVTLIAIALYLIIKKLSSKKSYKNTKLNNENICFGFYLRSCKYGVVNRYALLDFTKLLTERK